MDDFTAEPAAETVFEPVSVASAKQQLREFEDNVFGKNVSRINGDIERGIGSPYADMTAHQKAHYTALEQMVAAEQGMADASSAMAAAQAAHAVAAKAAANAEKASDETA